MSSERPYASCREVLADESQPRPGYGVQSTRLYPTISADAPLFSPYNECDYDAFFAGLDDDDLTARIDDNDDNELLLLVTDNEPADKLFAWATLIDS
jgi:hypothetical protein